MQSSWGPRRQDILVLQHPSLSSWHVFGVGGAKAASGPEKEMWGQEGYRVGPWVTVEERKAWGPCCRNGMCIVKSRMEGSFGTGSGRAPADPGCVQTLI